MRAKERQIRVAREATRRVDEEDAARTLVVPPMSGNLRDELRVAKPSPGYTIADLHPSGANTLLAAQYKAGKTTLMNNLAKSIADASPFLDCFDVCAGGRSVAMWNYEVSQ